jgi:hypothetical protein
LGAGETCISVNSVLVENDSQSSSFLHWTWRSNDRTIAVSCKVVNSFVTSSEEAFEAELFAMDVAVEQDLQLREYSGVVYARDSFLLVWGNGCSEIRL